MTEHTTTPEVTAENVKPASNKRWYVVHAYSGMEKAVERNLRERIDRSELQDKFGRILVPMEEVVELKNGKKSVSERRFFPGYVLVEMEMADDTWHLVKQPARYGLLGGARTPCPISKPRFMKLVNQMKRASKARSDGRVGSGANWCASRKRPVHRFQRRDQTSTSTSPRSASRSPSSAEHAGRLNLRQVEKV
jgi:transcription antitermination factor NusG